MQTNKKPLIAPLNVLRLSVAFKMAISTIGCQDLLHSKIFLFSSFPKGNPHARMSFPHPHPKR